MLVLRLAVDDRRIIALRAVPWFATLHTAVSACLPLRTWHRSISHHLRSLHTLLTVGDTIRRSRHCSVAQLSQHASLCSSPAVPLESCGNHCISCWNWSAFASSHSTFWSLRLSLRHDSTTVFRLALQQSALTFRTVLAVLCASV